MNSNRPAVTDDTAVLPPVPQEHTGKRTEGLAAELAEAAPRPWWNRGTLILAAMTVALGGFLGGVHVQKQYGAAPAAAGPPGARTGFTGAPGGLPEGFGGAGQGANGGTASAGAPQGAAAQQASGTVKLIDDTTIYVQTADGSVVTVRTTQDTSVQTSTASSLKNIKAGDAVTVQGETNAQGAVDATSVTSVKK